MKKIVIISSGQPSANPRAVKEALALSGSGYDVTFIYCPLSPWADEYDEKLFRSYSGIKWICAGSHPIKNKFGYYYARLRNRVYRALEKSVRSLVLFSRELKKEARRHKADLYIAHNLGAIEAAVSAAKKHGAKVGFDAEDFHRGEFIAGDPQQVIVTAVENKFFPKLDYCTAAAPLIGDAYREIFPQLDVTIINNIFSVKHLSTENILLQKKGIDLFWFSQFIGPARGLETVIDAMNKCPQANLRLHLLGNVKENYREFLRSKMNDGNQLFFIEPCDPEELFSIAAKFDIGLATEVPQTLNRDYCLTNKLFTYLLAGNCIVMSDTEAQKKFNVDYPGTGLVCEPYNADELAKIFTGLAEDSDALHQMKTVSRSYAESKLNWEQESKIFTALIHEVLTEK